MLVRDWMTRNPFSVGSHESLTVAVETMTRRKVRRLIVEANGHLAGILSRSDVLRAAPAGSNPFSAEKVPASVLSEPVRAAMTPAVISVPPLTPIEEAAQLMTARKIGSLPVLADGQVLGILTESDIFRAFVAMLGQADAGLRICFDISVGEDAVGFALGLAKKHRMSLASVSTYQQEGGRVAVVRLTGHEPGGMMEELWATGHRVLSVTRPSPAAGGPTAASGGKR
jgi:acetoin utilization protein AcuB